MADPARETARKLRDEFAARGRPLDWFEALYREAQSGRAVVPWADLKPNPLVFDWLDRNPPSGRTALKIGCGLGDDAEELGRRGFETTAFDISPTAIEECRRRFPGSKVHYRVADLLSPPADWAGRFDFVLESYTLQVLPPDVRVQAVDRIASFVAPGGILLLVCRAREEAEEPKGLHWPLTAREPDRLDSLGLKRLTYEDFMDSEQPPVRRFRISWRHPHE